MNELSAEVVHGKTSTYQRGCRCDCCREAQRLYQRAYRARSEKARESGRRQVRAYNWAEAQLRERHREEFDQLYWEAYHGTSYDGEVCDV